MSYLSSQRTQTTHPLQKMPPVISPCSPHPCFLSRISSVQKRKREQANCTGRSDSLASPSKAIAVLLAQSISFQLYSHRRDCSCVLKNKVKTACCDSKNSSICLFFRMAKECVFGCDKFFSFCEYTFPKAARRDRVVGWSNMQQLRLTTAPVLLKTPLPPETTFSHNG